MLGTVNLWAVFAGAVASMVIGSVWYGPLFGKRFMKKIGMKNWNPEEQEKMKKAILLLVVATIFIFAQSCEHPHETSETHEHHAKAELPELNKGQRWKADVPTKAGIAKLKEHIEKFEKEKNFSLTIADYQDFAKVLFDDINSIFATCKMTGQAHSELHKYLASLLKEVETMKGTDLKKSEQSIQSVKTYLIKFADFFE